MALDLGTISTGVDGFIKLIKDSGKIDINDAAARMGMSRQVLEEWAQVLEEQGLIKIEYQLTKVYLIWIASTKEETEVKKEAISDQRATTVRKAESQFEEMTKLGQQLDAMQKDFSNISEAFEVKMGGVKDRIEKLNEMKKQRQELLFRINELDKDYSAKIDVFRKQLAEQEKQIEAASKEKDALGEELKKLEPKVKQSKDARKSLEDAIAKARKEFDASASEASRVSGELAKDVELRERQHAELSKKLEATDNALKRSRDSLTSLERELDPNMKKFSGDKSSFGSELEKVSLSLEKDAKEATELVKSFEARVEKMKLAEQQMQELAKERVELTESFKKIVSELKNLEARKSKLQMDEVLKMVADAKQKLAKMEERREKFAEKQAEAKSSLKKIWEVEEGA